jgi:hypothetical protein
MTLLGTAHLDREKGRTPRWAHELHRNQWGVALPPLLACACWSVLDGDRGRRAQTGNCGQLIAGLTFNEDRNEVANRAPVELAVTRIDHLLDHLDSKHGEPRSKPHLHQNHRASLVGHVGLANAARLVLAAEVSVMRPRHRSSSTSRVGLTRAGGHTVAGREAADSLPLPILCVTSVDVLTQAG